jgi:hypothetical protein
MARYVQGAEAAHAAALKQIDDLEKRFQQNIELLVREVHEFITSKTPVNTGQAVRNMIWVRGEGHSIVLDALGSGAPGPTNSMTLGSEPRRAENEADAKNTIAGLNLSNPFGVFTLQNNAPDIVGLELGVLPGPPLTPRSPQGMFGLASHYFSSKIESKGIL